MPRSDRTGDRIRAALPLGPASLHVLLALADRSRHGLGIAQEAERATRGHIILGPATLYGAIKRLLDLGFIEDAPEAPKGDRADPRRRYYRITPVGRRALAVEAAELANVVEVARAKGAV